MDKKIKLGRPLKHGEETVTVSVRIPVSWAILLSLDHGTVSDGIKSILEKFINKRGRK